MSEFTQSNQQGSANKRKHLRYSSMVTDLDSQIIKTHGMGNWGFAGICVQSHKVNKILPV
jgi:hypothetical protein